MMKNAILFTFAIFLFTGGSILATPLDKSKVSVNAKWLLHADFDAFRESEFGKLVHDEIQRNIPDKINALAQLLGSNLATDLHAMTVYGPNANDQLASALIHCQFDTNKLLSFIILNEQYSKSEYNGFTLHHWKDEKKQEDQVGTFAADDLIVISQTVKGVTAALDVLDGKSKSLSQDPSSALGAMLDLPSDTIIAAAAQGLSELADDNEHAAILQNSRGLAFIAGEKLGNMKLHAHLEADSNESAIQIEQVMRGMLAFGMLQLNDHPQADPLLTACQINRTDNAVDFEFQYPSQELFDILKALPTEELDFESELEDVLTEKEEIQ